MDGERAIAVVGAGAAGLTAAWRLTSGGARVTLYEASSHVGGVLRTAEVEGARVDAGVQLVSGTHGALFALARQAGAGDVLTKSPGYDALWRHGRPHGIAYGSVSSMATSGALPIALKLRMAARYLPFLTREARGLDANDPAASGGVAFDGESIGEWGRREQGDDFVELLTYPLLAAYYGAEPEETSAAVYHALARVGMDVEVYGARDGFGALASAVADALKLRNAAVVTGARVRGVRVVDGGVEVDAAADGGRFDGAVLAVPARTAATLLGDAMGAPLKEWLGAVRQRSSFTVAFRTSRPYPAKHFGLSFPRVERPGDRLAALCVQSRKLDSLAPEDGDALVALPAPRAVPMLLEQDDATIAAAMLEAAEEAVSGMSRRVTTSRVYRFDDGYSLFPAGSLRHRSEFDAAWLPPGVALAGAWMVGPSVEGAVRSGERAADLVLEARR